MTRLRPALRDYGGQAQWLNSIDEEREGKQKEVRLTRAEGRPKMNL